MKLLHAFVMFLPLLVAAGRVKENDKKISIDRLQKYNQICKQNATVQVKNLKSCNNDLISCKKHEISEIARLENLIKECKANETSLQTDIDTMAAKFAARNNVCRSFVGGFTTIPKPGGSVYHFHSGPNDAMMSQSDAEALCQENSFKLVTIDDAAENAWLQNQITIIFTAAGLTGDATTYFRTNLKLQSDGTTWGWGSSGTAASYTDWKSGAVTYPDDAANNPCGNMRWQDNEVKWTNDDCTTPARFICELSDPCA